MAFTLRDDFTTDRAAGAVNGTAAEPGPGTRTCGSLPAITSGVLTYTGGVSETASSFSLNGVSRVAGKGLIIRCKGSTSNVAWGFGSTQINWPYEGGFWLETNTQYTAIETNSGERVTLLLGLTADTYYKTAIFQRATGYVYFYNNGTNWLLLRVGDRKNTATVYPVVYAATTAKTVFCDYMRHPSSLWLPTPLLSHSFASALSPSDGLGHAETTGLGSGGSGVTMTGATWGVSSGKAVNTPTAGGDIVTNGGFSADSDWTKNTGWSIGSGVATHAAVGSGYLTQTLKLTIGNWYRATATVPRYVAIGFAIYAGSNLMRDGLASVATFNCAGRATNTMINIYAYATTDADIDDVSYYELTLSTLFTNCQLNKSDVYSSVGATIPTAGFQGGMVLNLDSASSPANFVIVYYNRTDGKVYADKCVAGTYTNLFATTATYSAGANLVARKIGTSYYCWYNNAYVNSTTVSDAGIISNTLHGLFSTGEASEVQLDNFVVYASGSGGEYNYTLNCMTDYGITALPDDVCGRWRNG